MSVADHIFKTTVSDILQGKEKGVITVSTKDRFSAVLFKLLKEGITAAPLLDGDKPVGIVDVVDLTTYALVSFEESKLLTMHGDLDESIKTMGDIHPSLRHKWVQVEDSAPLKSLLDLFGSAKAGLHRIPVVDSEGKLQNIVSQSDVIMYCATAWTKFGLEGRVGEWARKKVQCAKADETVAKALEHLVDGGVSGVPVMDGDQLISTLSCTDLKGAPPASLFKFLSMSVREFKESARVPMRAQAKCEMGDSLSSVFQKFYDTQLHRLWVMEKGKLVGVVSLTDLIREFSQKAAK